MTSLPVCNAFLRTVGESDLEILLHGFSNMRSVVRGRGQVVPGVEHRLHGQVSDPEG